MLLSGLRWRLRRRPFVDHGARTFLGIAFGGFFVRTEGSWDWRVGCLIALWKEATTLSRMVIE